MGITKEQIFALADRLDADGQKATLALVRKQLGSGSFTTISEAMNEWRTRKASRVSPIREPVPQAVTGKLSELGGELWAVSLEMANSRLASEREALESLRQETGAARQEAAAAQTWRDGEAIREKLNVAQVQATTAEARAGELRTELDYAHEEARQARAEAAQAREEAAVLRGRLEALESVMAPGRSATKGNPLGEKTG